MTHIEELLLQARSVKASDLHLSGGLPPLVRVDGKLAPLPSSQPLSPAQINELSEQMKSGARVISPATVRQDLDFCYVDDQKLRYRVNLYRQQDMPTAAIRLLSDRIPTPEQLGLPSVITQLAMLPRGLVLVTGPTGSGKSTTLAAMIDQINRVKTCHILTLEDPVEYKHTHKHCMINQREVGRDTDSFSAALRSALREDPDVILVGEMRDLETISAAVTAAETGHLVLSTLHTTGAAATIDRIVDVFPPHQQQQIRVQLASVLRAVISQQLLPMKGGGRVAAMEVLIANEAAANMIRENKCHQMNTLLQTGAKLGMQSMDMHLAMLCKVGKVAPEEAVERAIDRDNFRRLVGDAR